MAAMNPEVKAKWLAALRSGQYKQTTQKLHTQFGFCCLGVLTDLYIKEKGLQWEAADVRFVRLVRPFKGKKDTLAAEVCDWAGLTNGDPAVTLTPEEADAFDSPERCTMLSVLNDTGATFGQISNVIEKYL